MGWITWAGGALLAAGLLMIAACDDAASGPDRPVRSAGHATAPAEIAQGVVGRVHNATGQPVAGARITAQSLDQPTRPIPEIAILSDADGRFVWPLRPGRYRLAAVVDGRELATEEATVEPGQVARVELSAPP